MNKLSFSIRNFNPDADIPALSQLMTEIEVVDKVGTDSSEETLQAQMHWRNHDPRQDRWLAEAAGAPNGMPVGHAWLFAQTGQRSFVYTAVHPMWRRQGIGRALMQKAIQRAQERGARQVITETEVDNQAGNSFLRGLGFEAVAHTRFFDAPANLLLPEPEWPQGFSVRAMTGEEELPLLVQASNRCYSDLWGHHEHSQPITLEFFQDLIQRRPGYIVFPGTFLVFATDGSLVGLCPCRLGPEDPQAAGVRQKILDAPGIAPELRSRGLYRPLLLTAMHWLDAQTYGPFRLETWGDPEEAVQAYFDLGFTLEPANHNIVYLLK